MILIVKNIAPFRLNVKVKIIPCSNEKFANENVMTLLGQVRDS